MTFSFVCFLTTHLIEHQHPFVTIYPFYCFPSLFLSSPSTCVPLTRSLALFPSNAPVLSRDSWEYEAILNKIDISAPPRSSLLSCFIDKSFFDTKLVLFPGFLSFASLDVHVRTNVVPYLPSRSMIKLIFCRVQSALKMWRTIDLQFIEYVSSP